MMRHKRALANLDEDIRDHIDRETQENIERGMSPEDARHAALRKFGNVTLVKEDTRRVWIPLWFEQLWQDAHYAVRMLRQNPGFTVTMVATLALGIGMNTAVFSVINAVLLRPLSYPQPERLVWVATTDPVFHEDIVPRYDFRAWREQGQSFERMVAYVTADNTIATTDAAIRARVAGVSEDFWDVARPALAFGRLPGPGETNAIVLSYRLFEERFQRNPSTVGRSATFDGAQVAIVGILQRTFRFELVPPPRRDVDVAEVDAYVPLEAAPQDTARSRGRTVSVVAKVKPNVTIEQARQELEVIRARIAQDSPSPYLDKMPLQVVPLQEKLVAGVRPALWVLQGAVTFVLLMASATVANLLLARASVRRKEIAIRASLGAGRARVLRQFLTEGLVLAFLGAAVGLIAVRWCLILLVHAIPHAIPRVAGANLDGRVVGFAVLTAVATILLFGLAPVLSIWNTELRDALRDGTRATSEGAGGLRIRRLLVVAELAIAVILLVGSGLMVKSFLRMNAHPPGFHPESILVVKVPLSGPKYEEAQARHAYADELLRQVQAIPGVQAVGVMPNYPIRTGLDVRGRQRRPDAGIPIPTTLNATSAGFASAMGLRVVRGRWLAESEPTPVVVVNESLARREFGDEDPVGRQLSVQAITPNPTVPFYVPIIGVVSDVKRSKLDAPAEPEVYVPYVHVPIGSGMAIVVRTPGDPVAMVPTIRRVMADLDPGQPIYDVQTLEDALADSLAPRRFTALVLNAFALTALVLAVVGIYGVMAYSVAQRAREIGLRMALGAQRRGVVGMVVRQGMQVALVGITIGVAAAAGLSRLMTTLLYDVEPTDPQTFGFVAALLAMAAFVACAAPAARATRVDPLTALRCE
jgi:putative ABC transport system permease protein